MKKMAVATVAALMWNCAAIASPIVSGFNGATLAACDDCSSTAQSLGFNIDFNGQQFSSVYVNNNGNVTFGAPSAVYTPNIKFGDHRGAPIIAPFFADVDTRYGEYVDTLNKFFAGGTVSYGQGLYTGISGRLNVPDYTNAKAFGVTWQSVVPWTGAVVDTRLPEFNTFQLLIVQSDAAPGAFEIIFNVLSIEWLSGDASPGANGASGFSDGTGNFYYNLQGSGSQGLLDGSTTSLNRASNTQPAVPGMYAFLVATDEATPASVPEPATLGLMSLGALALLIGRRRVRSSRTARLA